jgi:hypothetical protein
MRWSDRVVSVRRGAHFGSWQRSAIACPFGYRSTSTMMKILNAMEMRTDLPRDFL